jgi:hypothetical protein
LEAWPVGKPLPERITFVSHGQHAAHRADRVTFNQGGEDLSAFIDAQAVHEYSMCDRLRISKGNLLPLLGVEADSIAKMIDRTGVVISIAARLLDVIAESGASQLEITTALGVVPSLRSVLPRQTLADFLDASKE